VSFCPYDLRWRGSSVKISFFPHPEDPARYYSQKGAFFLFQSWRPYISVCTRYEFRCHLTLAVDFVHASSPSLEIREKTQAQILLREAIVSNWARFFFSLLFTIVPSVDFRKSITMATVGDDKLHDSSQVRSAAPISYVNQIDIN